MYAQTHALLKIGTQNVWDNTEQYLKLHMHPHYSMRPLTMHAFIQRIMTLYLTRFMRISSSQLAYASDMALLIHRIIALQVGMYRVSTQRPVSAWRVA